MSKLKEYLNKVYSESAAASFPEATIPDLPFGFKDVSWGNDAAARFEKTMDDGKTVIDIWIGDDDPELREGSTEQYGVGIRDEYTSDYYEIFDFSRDDDMTIEYHSKDDGSEDYEYEKIEYKIPQESLDKVSRKIAEKVIELEKNYKAGKYR